jgi:hypothetical protein
MWALQAAVLSEALEPIIVRGYSSIYCEPKGQPLAQVTGTSHEYGFDKYNALHQPELENHGRRFNLVRYCLWCVVRNWFDIF